MPCSETPEAWELHIREPIVVIQPIQRLPASWFRLHPWEEELPIGLFPTQLQVPYSQPPEAWGLHMGEPVPAEQSIQSLPTSQYWSCLHPR